MKREFNRLISMLLCVVLVAVLMPSVTSTASAASDIVAYAVEGGNIYFDKTRGEITGCDELITTANIPKQIEGISVTNIGYDAFYRCTSLTEIDIPNSVTSIGNYAFYGCTSLTEIDIPNSVTSIGNEAFDSCSNLKNIIVSALNSTYSSVDGVLFDKKRSVLIRFPEGKSGNYIIPDSVTSIGDHAFDGCTSLTEIDIPNSVTSIGNYAFFGCTSLTEIDIPNSVTSIGNEAFNSCSNLKNIRVNALNSTYSSVDGVLFDKNRSVLIRFPEGKSGNYIIPDSVTSIGDRAFYNCRRMTGVQISDRVRSIGESAFWLCNRMSSISIPTSVIVIKPCAFYGCSNLLNVIIPDSVTEIGHHVFYDCDSLSSVIIPDSVTDIGFASFANCDNLVSVVISKSVTEIPMWMFLGCNDLTSVTIPSSVTSIGPAAFDGCSNLTNVTIPPSVTDIGYYAFHGCSSLTSVSIPSSVTYIGAGPFYNCSSLFNITVEEGNNKYVSEDGVLFKKDKSVLINCPGGKSGYYTIPDSVTDIGEHAFDGCSSLTGVKIPYSVTNIHYSTFDNCSSLINITVEAGNSKFSSEDGVLFNKDNSVLIKCPGGKSGYYTIPDSVTDIGEHAFDGCNSLTGVKIPYSVTNIHYFTFDNCSSLINITVEAGNSKFSSEDGVLFNKDNSVLIKCPEGKSGNYIIPDSVTNISCLAFRNCSSLTIVSIPHSVVDIEYGAFDNCSSLNSISVEDGNSSYVSEDGVLFDKNRSELVQYPGGKSGVYVIPDGVNRIGAHAFVGCGNLTSVTIPVSVTSIGYSAFYGCNNLNSIYYVGSESEWSTVFIDEVIGEDNSFILNATIHYNSTGPSSGLVKLATPTNLTWDTDWPGNFKWHNNLPTQEYYLIKLYRAEDPTTVVSEVYFRTGAEEASYSYFLDRVDSLGSGSYFFTVQSIGDGVEYSDSDVAVSPVWSYVEPSAQLPAFNVTGWQWPNVTYHYPGDLTKIRAYQLDFYVASTLHGEKRRIYTYTDRRWSSWGVDFITRVNESALFASGEGYYFYRVKPLSADITQYQNGPWSDYSEPYYFSGLDIAQQLNEIVEGGGTDEDIRSAVQNLNRDALRDAMLADTDNTGAVATMAELEEGLATTFAVESTLDTFAKSDVTVVGALLNPVTSSQVVLNIGRPQVEHVLPTLYNQSLAVQFSMELNGVQDTDDLAVPVVMTLPVPDSINPNFLVILHYPAGGGAAERIDSSQYYLYQQGGRWFVRFVLDHFSDFAMTQELTEDYKVVIEDYTKGAAAVNDLVSGGQYSGQTSFTVSCDNACVVAYTTDGGATHTRLSAGGSGNTRSFSVDVTQDMTIMVALKGDLNLDGKVALADAAQAKRYCAGLRTLTAEQMLAADVVIDGEIKLADAAQIQRFCSDLRVFEW